ncbi:metallophosphoesterase [Candidatus Bipolaricaulota bacterium]|nr:metallophosphoesterase [Candidatus Bipolaricaulota bacterium]
MKILHISDTHVTDTGQFREEALTSALAELASNDFDLFIHSGDVTDMGRKEQFERAADLFDDISIPRIIVPGNHDKRSGGLTLFKQNIGPARGVEFIGEDAVATYVDSGVNDLDEGRVGTVQFNMIKDTLNSNQDKSLKIVVLHHHTIPIPWTGKERNVLSNAGDLLDLFIKSDVDLVLSGHKHFPNTYKLENTLFINAGTVSDRKTRYGDTNSYNVICVDKDKTRVHIKRHNGHVKSKTFARSRKKVFTHFGGRKARIAQMSNTFISDSYRFREGTYKDGVQHLNDLAPDLVVHCGGIVEEGIAKHYWFANSLLKKIEATVLFTPAGRDINYLGYQLYSENFGSLDQEYDLNGVYLRGISSAQYDSNLGVIGETERTSLFHEISEHDADFKLLFLHHNVLPIPHSREKGLLEDSGDLLRESVDNNVHVILTGTSSHPFATRINNTVVANANSFSSIYQRSLYGNSFNLIDIYEKIIVVSEVNCLWGTRRILGMWPVNNTN